jgi:pimeloyl-ACP methyl ester carboxylesterase
MDANDTTLRALEAGPAPLPPAEGDGQVEHDGARLWFATYGSGPPVLLLHGGLGSGEDWGNQVPALVRAGYRAIVIDSRGHGRSTRDARPLDYERMASDVLAVMDALGIAQARVVGWSDGAILGLILGMRSPERVARVFAFAGNMDLGGVKPFSPEDPVLQRAFARAAKAYARLSETPLAFGDFAKAVGTMMETQPNFTAEDLARVRVPVAIVAGERDEFITPEHLDYLARTIPGAARIVLPDATHFAPLATPRDFNDTMLGFLGGASS